MDMGTIARQTGIYDVVEPVYSKRQRSVWEKSGRPIPAPSSVKRSFLRDYASRFRLRTLVETGTYKADTVRALRSDFDQIHSIEIVPELHRRASDRCRRQGNAHLHLGDSGVELSKIVAGLKGPTLFWLDAHQSGGVTGGEVVPPIIQELETCLDAAAGHVVLIDDMREFGGDPSYPSLAAVESVAAQHGYDFTVVDDVARLTPSIRADSRTPENC